MVTNWDECNTALKDMAEIDSRVAQSVVDRDAAQKEAQEIFDSETADDLKLRGKLETEVEKFAKRRRKDVVVDGKKSKVLPFGEIKFQGLKPSVAFLKGFDEEKSLEAIKANLRGAARKSLIRKKESIDKQAALKAKPDALAKVGLKVESDKEKIIVKTYPEKLAS